MAKVTFTFALRKAPDQKSVVMCRKEATFTFNKGADNRGWKECVPGVCVKLLCNACVRCNFTSGSGERLLLSCSWSPCHHARRHLGFVQVQISENLYRGKGSQRWLRGALPSPR